MYYCLFNVGFTMKKLLTLLFILFSVSSYAENKTNVCLKNEDRKLDIINYKWWGDFNDPYLSNYILYGIENNNDLHIIESKIREYKEFTKYTFGSELPSVSTSLMHANVKDIPYNENVKMNAKGLMLPLSVNYELDLFGKNRNKTQSTKKQLEAYELQRNAFYITYVSELSSLYFNIVKLNKLIDLTTELVTIKKSILDNASVKFENKLISEGKLNSYIEELKTTENNKTELLKTKNILLTQLAVLIGDNPNDASRFNFIDLYNVNIKFDIKEDYPSDVIFNRPDVLSVEKEMEKSKIDIKVARKEFLPTFNISGGVVFNNIASGGFFSLSNTIKDLIVGCSQSLFVGGRKKANLKMMHERYMQILETYKKVSLQAIKEVNDSLHNMVYDYDINKKNNENYSMEYKNFSNNQVRYENNLISDTQLLELKQKLIQKEIIMVSSRIQLIIDYISLYKSVGGNFR